MKYISTRNNELEHSLEEALRLGLAKDGGLFVPATFPQVYHKDKNISRDVSGICQGSL